MLPYLALLVLPAWFSIISARRFSIASWAFVFACYLIFVGFRYEISPDWWGYLNLHKTVSIMDFSDVMFGSEPLSHSLFWISENLGFDILISNIVAALILLVGVFSFAKRTYNPWLAVMAATPYFIIVMGMSGVRQSMAAGLMLYLLSKWRELSQMGRAIYVLIAALFHTSALVNSILLVTQLHVPRIYKALLGGGILAITYLTASEVPIFAESMAQYQQRYIDDPNKVDSLGAIFHVGLIILPASIGFLFRKRMLAYIHDVRLFSFGIYASFAVLCLNFLPFLSNTLSSRLSTYMYFLPMMVYPALANVFGRSNSTIMTFLIIVFHFLVLITWLLFANHSTAYVPYKNVLFV